MGTYLSLGVFDQYDGHAGEGVRRGTIQLTSAHLDGLALHVRLPNWLTEDDSGCRRKITGDDQRHSTLVRRIQLTVLGHRVSVP
jgi:hypothetical protein